MIQLRVAYADILFREMAKCYGQEQKAEEQYERQPSRAPVAWRVTRMGSR
jgi:hypothetical protein